MEMTLEQAREVLECIIIADDNSGMYIDLIDLVEDEISGMERELEGYLVYALKRKAEGWKVEAVNEGDVAWRDIRRNEKGEIIDTGFEWFKDSDPFMMKLDGK